MSSLRVQSNNPTNVSDTKKILKSTSVSRPTRRKSQPSWMTHKSVEQKFTARSSAHVKHNAGLNFRPPRHVGGFAPAGATKHEHNVAVCYDEGGDQNGITKGASDVFQKEIKALAEEEYESDKTGEAMAAIRGKHEDENAMTTIARKRFIERVNDTNTEVTCTKAHVIPEPTKANILKAVEAYFDPEKKNTMKKVALRDLKEIINQLK